MMRAVTVRVAAFLAVLIAGLAAILAGLYYWPPLAWVGLVIVVAMSGVALWSKWGPQGWGWELRRNPPPTSRRWDIATGVVIVGIFVYAVVAGNVILAIALAVGALIGLYRRAQRQPPAA